MTTREPLSPYLSKPLRSLEEVLQERRAAGRQAAVSHRVVEDMPFADNSNARQTAPLRARSA